MDEEKKIKGTIFILFLTTIALFFLGFWFIDRELKSLNIKHASHGEFNYSLRVVETPMFREELEISASPDIELEEKNITSGIGSWYDYSLDGVEWSINHNTAASRTLKRYSHAKITNIENGESVVVFINDYGPERWTGREIDLSSHAFKQLAPLSSGLIKVQIEPLQ